MAKEPTNRAAPSNTGAPSNRPKSGRVRFSRTDVKGHNDALRDKGRSRSGGGFEPHLKHRFRKRIVALLCVFCFVIGVFAINLIALQAAGNAYSVFEPPHVATPAYTKTVTLQAPRGEIYDREGTKLVTNATSYTVRLDYDAFYASGGIEQRNRTLLALRGEIEQAVAQSAVADRRIRAEFAPELFPFDGIYPDLTLNEAAKDEGSEVYRALRQTLEYLGMPYSSASQIVQYYVTIYGLSAHEDGIPLYTDEEITTLIRLYYNMDRQTFSPGIPYAMAHGIDNAHLSRILEQHVAALRVSATQTRIHLYAGYASHILGDMTTTAANNPEFCNALGYPVNEIKGKSGCEGTFDAYLQGEDGEMLVTYDEHGAVLSCEVTKDALPGQDIYLTLDIALQIAAEDALRVNVNTVANTGSTLAGIDCNAGAVVALDPSTGEILAMGSYPTYNDIIQGQLSENEDASPYLNRATNATYAPSELFQLCTSIAALDRGKIDGYELISDDGVMQAGESELCCPLHERFGVAHEQLSLPTALSDGCDVFFGKLGTRLGASSLLDYAKLLGLGQGSGIEIAEQPGVLSDATATNAALLAAGHSDTECTPLQLCSMLGTLMQGGKRYGAHLFLDTRSYISGTILEASTPQLLAARQLYAEDVDTVLDAMQRACRANTLLYSRTEALQQNGIEIGCLGARSISGTMNSADALLLAYGADAQSGRQLALCVVLEHGADASLASPTAATVLSEYFAK